MTTPLESSNNPALDALAKGYAEMHNTASAYEFPRVARLYMRKVTDAGFSLQEVVDHARKSGLLIEANEKDTDGVMNKLKDIGGAIGWFISSSLSNTVFPETYEDHRKRELRSRASERFAKEKGNK